MRRVFIPVFAFALQGAFAACSGDPLGLSKDAGTASAVLVSNASADDKSLIYNLVGRWYPEDEIKRLSDRTLTPEQWCEREPSTVFVYPEKVEVRCAKGAPYTAMIASSTRDKDGAVLLTMRAKEDSPLKLLRFRTTGAKATISGSPCFEGDIIPYARFPDYEIIAREVLNGRRCAQLTPAAAAGSEHPERPEGETAPEGSTP